MSMFDDAIQAIRMGDKEEGRRLLEEMLENDEGNENIWLWLTTVVDSDEDREVCLDNVLAINPNHAIAKKSLDSLKAGNFDPGEIIRSAIREEEPPDSGATFLDEFRRFDDETEDEDEDLVMPSTMAKSKGKSKGAAKKKGSGFKLNPRLIVLAVVALLIVCALGSVAVYNLMGGNLESGGEQVVPETPVGGGEAQPTAEPVASDTPAVPPTNTPEPTRPPLELPTPKPTAPPTPTATPVVAPTAGSQ